MPLSLEELQRIAAQTGISLRDYWDKGQSAIEAHIQQVLRGMRLVSISEVLRSRRYVHEVPTSQIREPSVLRSPRYIMDEATWRDILHWAEEDARPTSMEPQAQADPWSQEHWTVEASRRVQQQMDEDIFQMLTRQADAAEALRQTNPEYVGPFTVRSELAVLPADSSVQGWRMHEVRGEPAINPNIRRVQVPLFEIASNPTIQIGALRSGRFDLYGQVSARAARDHAIPIWEAFMASKKQKLAKTPVPPSSTHRGTDFFCSFGSGV